MVSLSVEGTEVGAREPSPLLSGRSPWVQGSGGRTVLAGRSSFALTL